MRECFTASRKAETSVSSVRTPRLDIGTETFGRLIDHAWHRIANSDPVHFSLISRLEAGLDCGTAPMLDHGTRIDVNQNLTPMSKNQFDMSNASS